MAMLLVVCLAGPGLTEPIAEVATAGEEVVSPVSGGQGSADNTQGRAKLSVEKSTATKGFLLVPMDPLAQLPADPCDSMDGDFQSWLDSSQIAVYRSVCGAAAWFDGFFGDLRYDRATANTFGRIGAGAYWDERGGLDQKFRFRAKFALPGIRKRGALLVGRGDEEQLLEERGTTRAEQLPGIANPNSSQDDSLYAAFGYKRIDTAKRGLDFGVGVKLRLDEINPFAKVSYRRVWQLSENNLAYLRPIVYWRNDEGFGSTVTGTLDHYLNSAMLLRWRNFVNASEDEAVEGFDLGSNISLSHALSRRKALTYSIFVRGETKADVTTQNFGVEFRYRQRIFRDWIFIEYIGGLSWPRYLLTEDREPNFGSGLMIEAYFGPAPENWVR